MPIQKKKSAPRSKLVRRKRLARRPRGYPTLINRSLQPIAQRTIVKMKYAEAVTPQMTTGLSSAVYRFNLNSIFDPNRTGTGHQPYGHDTFSTMYNRYRVIGVKWNIQCVAPSGTDLPLQVAALPANEEQGSSGDSASSIRELPRARYITQGYAGAPVRSLKGYTSLPSLTGRTKAQYMADDRYQAQVGSSPQELAILNIIVSFMNEFAVGSTIYPPLNIEMTYVVEFFDPKVLAQS